MSSTFLDQVMLEDVANNCPNDLLAFHQCMAKPPSEADCLEEQKNLSMCIKSKVTTFQKINAMCSGKLQAYEACLRINGSEAKCKQDLASLRDCATKALK